MIKIKIGIHTDAHFSYTSSIMPIHSDGKYSMRLDMLVKTGKWMYNLFEEQGVDIIVNCGDTLDSHIVRAEEMTALSEFYNYSKGTPEYTLIGNHDTLDNSREFYSTSILDNIKNIHIINQPCVIKIPYSDEKLAFLPYMKSSTINDKLLSDLSVDSYILFSHIDIKGSHLRPDYIMEDGIDAELLSMKFDFVFNGHLHTAERINTSEGYICNIGSVSSNSFSDNNHYVPSVLVFDTKTGKIERFLNPYAILFRKATCHRLKDLSDFISGLDKDYKYIIKVKVPYSIKDNVRQMISENKNIVSYRIIVDTSSSKSTVSNIQKIGDNDNIKEDFCKFLSDNQDIIKYPLDLCKSIIKEI